MRPDSTWALYRHLLAERRVLDAVAPLEWELDGSDEVVVYRRGEVLVALNVTDHAVALPADLTGGRAVVASSVRGHTDATTVPSDACVWLRIS
jgi:hypothetical protein